jgi:hypothetical protein
MKSKLLVATLVAVLFPLALPAQDEAKVAIKIDVVAWGTSPSPLPVVEIEKADEGNKRLVPEGLAKLREKQPALVALVPLPAASRHVTILLVPAAEGTFLGYVIDDDPRKLPAGKLRIHNLSPHRITMKIAGSLHKELDPHDTFVAAAPQGHVIYQLAYLIDDKWKTQENNIIPVLPDEQTQLIVLKSRNQFSLSSDGATGGFLQMVKLRRKAKK